ncbi:hypothetical protein RHSIM_Rhsim10G0111800 [Rhododendron simsii]|uniref:Uncharacterized protein n=1 Tax=Rhododendron simsii TaxID=118357 RepID=A0A834GD84_RHOSS|nr:hypothetical protein RHSIM_Rhsim10G0111800 [Rhododendron simsii]
MGSSKDDSATDGDNSGGELPDSDSSLFSEGEKVLAYHGPRIYEAKWVENATLLNHSGCEANAVLVDADKIMLFTSFIVNEMKHYEDAWHAFLDFGFRLMLLETEYGSFVDYKWSKKLRFERRNGDTSFIILDGIKILGPCIHKSFNLHLLVPNNVHMGNSVPVMRT